MSDKDNNNVTKKKRDDNLEIEDENETFESTQLLKMGKIKLSGLWFFHSQQQPYCLSILTDELNEKRYLIHFSVTNIKPLHFDGNSRVNT